MDQTDHVLLVGDGANQFAREIGIETIESSNLIAEHCYNEWLTYKQYSAAVNSLFNNQLNQ